MRIPFFMPVYVVDDKFLVRRKTCLEQTVPIGSNPYYATRILKERQDRFYLFLRIMGKCPSLYGITVQPVLPCTDKQIALLVFQHGLNIYAFGDHAFTILPGHQKQCIPLFIITGNTPYVSTIYLIPFRHQNLIDPMPVNSLKIHPAHISRTLVKHAKPFVRTNPQMMAPVLSHTKHIVVCQQAGRI